MAYEGNYRAFSWEANADLSTKQYYVVQLNTSEKIALADATVRVIGVLQNEPASGEACEVAIDGICKVITDGTTPIAAMDALASDANGKAVKTTTDNDEIVGWALAPSTADGTIIPMLLAPLRRY